MYNLSFYGSHNATVALSKDNTIVEIIEIERLLNRKNQGLCQYVTAHYREDIVNYLKEYLYSKYKIDKLNTVYFQNTDTRHNEKLYKFERYFPADEYKECQHHIAHAANSLYQSEHNTALILSFDGGGNDGWFNIYLGEKGQDFNLLERVDKNVGVCYSMFGNFVKQIYKCNYGDQGNLVYPGKLMGLAGYGNVREEWVEEFTKWYNLYAYDVNIRYFREMLKRLNISVDGSDNCTEQDSKDLAATNQYVFEEFTYGLLKPHLDKYPNVPLHLAGGSALNVLFNTRMSKEREVFVAPNPSDCGLATGMLLDAIRPSKPVDITYEGLDTLDKHTLPGILENKTPLPYSHEQMVRYIKEGKIIGVVRGKSEHGPRALGNRSILCDPVISDMKDILNAKVKNREFYRPFAPVVRLEDVNKYFEWDRESRWMSSCPLVRDEYRDQIPSVVHIDGTARVQTVTEDQNKWLYDLLSELDKQTGTGILINTSFNQQGKPLVSTYSQALEVLNNTRMDHVVLENYIL